MDNEGAAIGHGCFDWSLTRANGARAMALVKFTIRHLAYILCGGWEAQQHKTTSLCVAWLQREGTFVIVVGFLAR